MTTIVETERLATWNRVWALAIIFGLVSVPWTYGFVAQLRIPLWPAFVASASVFAADAQFDRSLASNLVGIGYAAATLAVVNGLLGGGVVALSLVVGGFMLLASLHAVIPPLSFTPGAFFGYAALFGVHAAGATAFGVTGLVGVTLATAVSMSVGAGIGWGAHTVSRQLA